MPSAAILVGGGALSGDGPIDERPARELDALPTHNP
jgi:hypothetical protein